MHAKFGEKRESDNTLFFHEWKNDKGVFQFHSQIELYFVLEGEMDAFIGDRYRRLSAGEMSVALSYTAHGYVTPESSRSAALIIPTYICEEFVKATSEKRAHDPFICDKERVREMYALAKKIADPGTGEIEKKGYVYVILGRVLDALELVGEDESVETGFLPRLLTYVGRNFTEDITPESVSRLFGYNQSYVSRAFKQYFGIGLKKYMTLTRLRNALMLLHDGRHDITSAALDSGFGSTRSFYRAFREEFGTTPKEYLENKERDFVNRTLRGES